MGYWVQNHGQKWECHPQIHWCLLCFHAFNLLVYWQLRCVIGAVFSISCMLLVNWLAIVCTRRGGSVMYSSADTLCTFETQVNLVIPICSRTFWKSQRLLGKGKARVWRDRRENVGNCAVVCLLHNFSHWLLVALPRVLTFSQNNCSKAGDLYPSTVSQWCIWAPMLIFLSTVSTLISHSIFVKELFISTRLPFVFFLIT